MLKLKRNYGFLVVFFSCILSTLLVYPQIVIANNDKKENPQIDPPEIDTKEKRSVLSSENFVIEINGGGTVPFYHFNTTAGEARFFLKFQRIVQYKDVNDDNIFTDNNEIVGNSLALTSVDWELEIIDQTSTNINFALVSSQIHNPLFSDVKLQLVNHFIAGSPAIKFDINITNWPFVEEATGLSLEYELSWNSNSFGQLNNGNGSKSGIYKEFNDSGIYIKNDDGDALVFLESVNEVNIDGTLDDQGAILSNTAAENAPKLNIYINYPRFNNYIIHDPTLGTSLAAILPLKDSATTISWIQENVKAGFLGVTVLVTVIFATLAIYNRRKKV